MKESSTYRMILSEGMVEGRVEGERRLLQLMAQQQFGEPSPAARAALDGINDPERFERMAVRLPSAAGWDDLLATP